MANDDYYSATSVWYYIIQLGLAIYGVAFFGYLVIVQNANVPTTVFPANQPWGTYYSQVYNSIYWLMLLLSLTRILMIPVVFFAVLWRKTRGCVIFWNVLIIIITFNDMLVVVGSGTLYGNCNLQGQTYNPCNDARWCCVTQIYSSMENGCVNNIACPAGFPTLLSQLSANADFLWFFYLNLAFFLMDVLIMIFFASEFYISPMALQIKLQAKERAELEKKKDPLNEEELNKKIE